MFLKRLELHGFKSFAQKAVLEFLPSKDGKQSITAIVGPNGSGKSNISDALLWVMGEQSMKLLRGKKSADVIFSGSETKGQMGMASVTIVLDNSDQRMPLEYEEIAVTRRFYRSGDSEYLINGNNVRLLDLQLLLAKAQFGQGSYSVIGQGMIDHLLFQSAAERKEFFDEATGIKEFQIKRHQGVLKLKRTKENISQAEILLQEVTSHLRILSRQVKKLEQRQEIELKLRELQEGYYTALFKRCQFQLDYLLAGIAKVNSNHDKINQRLSTIQEELADLARAGSRQAIFSGLQNEYQETVQKKNNLEREKAVLMGRLQAEYSQSGKQNIGWMESKILNLKAELARLMRDLDTAQNSAEEISEHIKKQNQEVEKINNEKNILHGKIIVAEQKLLQAKSEQSYWHLTGLKAVQAILEERQRFGQIYGAVAQLGEVEEEYRLALDVAAGNYLSSIVVDNDETAEECIRYLREHQLGVATFLPLNTIKSRLLVQDIVELKKEKGVRGLAVELVKYDKKFANIFSYVLGNTLIVDDIEVARRIGIGKVRMITLQGDVLEVSGSMKGGYRSKDKKQGLSFAHGESPHLLSILGIDLGEYEMRIANWQRELKIMEINFEKAQRILQELNSSLQVSLARADLLKRQKQALQQEIYSLQQEFSLANMNVDEFNLAKRDLSKQKEDSDGQINVLENSIKEIEKKIADFNREEEEKKQKVFALQENLQAEQKKLNSIVEERNQKKIEIARLETRQEDLANEVWQEIHVSLRSILEKGAEAISDDGLEDAQQQIQKLKYQLSLIGGIEGEVVEEYQVTKERHDFLTTQLADLQHALEDLEKLVIELDELMKKKREKVFRQIKKEFTRYFNLLFDGGKADLVEVYGEVEAEEAEEEETEVVEGIAQGQEVEKEIKKAQKERILVGIEIVACPPGKKIKHINSLSGGERTMTSLALICAILRINPPPFVVLDEVEAALDESNTIRFTRILHELAFQSQFILITHNQATLHTVDVLYGTTMGADGVSKLVSIKLENT